MRSTRTHVHLCIFAEIFTLIVILFLGKVLPLAPLDVELVHDLLVQLLRLVAEVIIHAIEVVSVGCTPISVVPLTSSITAVIVIVWTIVWSCCLARGSRTTTQATPLACRTPLLRVAL
jgi:hypothetical protein